MNYLGDDVNSLLNPKHVLFKFGISLLPLRREPPLLLTIFKRPRCCLPLKSLSRTLKESEIVSFILAVLGTDHYDLLVTSVTTRIEPISPEEL
jgi:hypothetical protein